jgi:hypothetical protein
MATLSDVAPAFVEMAHRIVWCTAATVDVEGRPRTRVLHPLWEWDGDRLVGWIATGPTPVKAADLAAHPFLSCSYWAPSHDTCIAECATSWVAPEERAEVWRRFVEAPAPVGYDPAIVPAWKDGPESPAFGGLRLEPWLLRVFPGSALLGQGGDILRWSAPTVG